MKTRLVLAGFLIVFVVFFVVLATNPVLRAPPRAGPAARARADLLRRDVEWLANLRPARSFEHPETLQKAAAEIFRSLADSGLRPRYQDFEVDGRKVRNVIARLGPSDGELVVIGAHYDVFEELPGADDNASGVAGLLEVARLLKPLEARLPRPVELVAYTLEEPPHFATENMGSYHHADQLRREGRAVRLMISLEMIGYFSDEPDSQDYPMSAFSLLYPSRGNYIAMIARPRDWFEMRAAKKIFLGATDLPLRTANIPRFVPGVDYSDHASYWQMGFPALMVTDTAFMRNRAYHTGSDRPERLDYNRMGKVIDGIVAIALELE